MARINYKALLAEVHRRMVTDHYTGTAPTSPRWWTCRVCEWIWKAGDAELHEPSCPLGAYLASAEEGAK